MKQNEIIKGFLQLGKLMVLLGEKKEWDSYSTGVTKEEYDTLQNVINRQISYNGWFTEDNVRKSLLELGSLLTEEQLSNWLKKYTFTNNPITVAVIMAGNIPLVGFHDFVCVLLSGNRVAAKLSSDDKTLLPALAEHLVQFVPGLGERIVFSTGRIAEMDAVIATGSDNSLTYFKQYFGKYPHIFRKNRTSIAVLSGRESAEEMKELANDVFSYFGLGCRNVSHLMVPEGFNIDLFFEGIYDHGGIVHNNKYGNNYDYNKAVYLLNQHPLLDNNFVLLRESADLFSPLAMIHYQYYKEKSDVDSFLADHEGEIQVVVGHDYTPFGKAQSPQLDDYADGVDVMDWLQNIS